jgi:hypothetical protein
MKQKLSLFRRSIQFQAPVPGSAARPRTIVKHRIG